MLFRTDVSFPDPLRQLPVTVLATDFLNGCVSRLGGRLYLHDVFVEGLAVVGNPRTGLESNHLPPTPSLVLLHVRLVLPHGRTGHLGLAVNRFDVVVVVVGGDCASHSLRTYYV